MYYEIFIEDTFPCFINYFNKILFDEVPCVYEYHGI